LHKRKWLKRGVNKLFFRRAAMNSPVVKRSIVIAGHKTSVSLEDAFWRALKEISLGRRMTLSSLVTAIDVERQQGNLSSCLRLFVLNFYRNQVGEIAGARTAPLDVMATRLAESA
jgi:predicted DNA-binding ribbon-helix-helix protein